MKNNLVHKDAHTLVKYYALCNLMVDIIDEKWTRSSLNIHKVKLLTNQLKSELEKSINRIFNGSYDDKTDIGQVLDQFVNASTIMDTLFELGLIMDEMEDDKKDKFNQELNDLLKKYGVEIKG